MRFVAPGDWIRIKFDLKPLVRHACGESYMRSHFGSSLWLKPLWLKLSRLKVPVVEDHKVVSKRKNQVLLSSIELTLWLHPKVLLNMMSTRLMNCCCNIMPVSLANMQRVKLSWC